ncbi:MAG: FMN-binding protein [Blautia sp.]|nr:FMN-binding protein [Blautia sp.]
MKKILSIALALFLCLTPSLATAEEFDPSQFLDWFTDSYLWMTVQNEHFSSDPADQITDEELARIFKVAMLQQNAVHWNPYFFIVIKDVEEQKALIGDAFNAGTEMATEGTVTVLLVADQILTQEEGHVTPYEGYYTPTVFAYYDSGLTSGVLGVAAATLGYQTHYFGTVTGEHAPYDLAEGKYQSMSYYIHDDYTRTWGFQNSYEGEIAPTSVYPVAGNCVFVSAIVIGKRAADEELATWATMHARPDNWVIWDGVPNEEPSPAIAAYEAIKAAGEGEAEIELAENEYLGVGQGNNGTIKVKVTVEDGAMTGIEVVEHSESSLADEAIASIPEAILAAQSVDVDDVAGATVASSGIKEAVADALKQAGIE